ncbi:hypothetical protein MBLNU457_3310t1 [Dothideomycetes sp. NU457]
MTTLHSIGLPWWGVLPVSAFLVRTFIVLPFFQIPRRRDIAKMMLLQPLLEARMSLWTRLTLKNYAHAGWWAFRYELFKQRIWYGRYLADYWKIKHRIIKRFGGFIVLALMSEALRRLCGVREGLVSLFFKPWGHLLSTLDQYHTDAMKAIFRKLDELLGGKLSETEEFRKWLEEQKEKAEDKTEEESAMERRMKWFEPSLETEGPFFCRDLTKRDETMVLPTLFVGSYFASILFAPRADASKPKHTPSWNQKSPDELILLGEDEKKSKDKKSEGEKGLFEGLTNLQRIFLTFSVFLTLPALQMPSALLMYFISSIGIGALQTRMLARAIPIRFAPGACRRPVRRDPPTQRD